MSRTRIYVPRETAAVSVGADEVALAIAQVSKDTGTDIELIRNGSWGASWLEPLVEVEVDGARIAYGNVTADEVAGLFAANFIEGGDHERRLGATNEIPYLIDQDRWTFWRCGLTNPLSIEDFEAHQGFTALSKAFADGAEAVLSAVMESGLRGRGGAGFPTEF
jgi:formate dehydrogenase iron-sulfur subunit